MLTDKKILHLTLKKQWFDLILSGEKEEEYRELKPFWIRRLVENNYPVESKEEGRHIALNIAYDILNEHNPADVLKAYYAKYKTFDVIHFTNGYGKHRPQIVVECKGIEIRDTGNKDWGFESQCFVISLGTISEKINIK